MLSFRLGSEAGARVENPPRDQCRAWAGASQRSAAYHQRRGASTISFIAYLKRRQPICEGRTKRSQLRGVDIKFGESCEGWLDWKGRSVGIASIWSAADHGCPLGGPPNGAIDVASGSIMPRVEICFWAFFFSRSDGLGVASDAGVINSSKFTNVSSISVRRVRRSDSVRQARRLQAFFESTRRSPTPVARNQKESSHETERHHDR